MAWFTRYSLRIRIFLFFAVLAIGSSAAVIAGIIIASRRSEIEGLGGPMAIAGVIAIFAILGLSAWIWYLFDLHVAQAIQKLAGTMMARAHADVDRDIDQTPAKYLGDLAPAAQAMTENLTDTRTALNQAVETQTAHLAQEKALLANLLADVPEGVLFCSSEHNLVFYNGSAVDLLSEEEVEPALNRSLFTCLWPGPIHSAYARLQDQDDGTSTELICATRGEGRVLSARMRIMRQNGDELSNGAPGYVLTLRDITANLARHADRQERIDVLIERIRRPVLNLQNLLESVQAAQTMPDFRKAIEKDITGVARDIERLGATHDQDRAEWWPRADHRATDIVDGVISQLAHQHIDITVDSDEIILHCDAYQIIALIDNLSVMLVRDHKATDLTLLIKSDGTEKADISLGWTGNPLPGKAFEHWLGEQMNVGRSHMTGRTILQGHGTVFRIGSDMDGNPKFSLSLRQSLRQNGRIPDQAARGAYDFELLDHQAVDDLIAVPLQQLSYVVFDTETTGLLPYEGDEIVQIAGLRIVNGRRVGGEEFDSLVHPGRTIPPKSTEIHGITDEMVADAEPIEVVGRRFHRFAEGAVLIAHNAPFDMAFFKRHQGNIGKDFDHPVLDTVLLSAVLFGQSETHTLDALTDRLGIEIPPELRHTAMGDTVATAAAFEKMLPMLQARGVNTFGDALIEVRKHARLLEDLNTDRKVPA